jgi:hypothetical protein
MLTFRDLIELRKIPRRPPDLSIDKHRERFQCQTWLIKLWRYRHYLKIPRLTIKWWLNQKLFPYDFDEILPIKTLWLSAKRRAHFHMKWYYTSWEVTNLFYGPSNGITVRSSKPDS